VPLIWLQNLDIGDIIDEFCEDQSNSDPIPCSCLNSAMQELVQRST
jgi:hypothetical protein